MSTRGPAPRSAARRHLSMNPKALSGLAHGRPIRAEAGCGTRHALAAPTLVLPRRPDLAPEQRTGGQRCGYRTAEPSRKSVHPTGESERRRGRTGIGRCGYLPPTSTRLAVDFNGERRHPLEPRADRGVDIRPPTRLETLCNRPVSAPARFARSPRHCGHPASATNRNAVHPMGEDAPVLPREPLPHGPRAPTAAPADGLPPIPAFSRQPHRPRRDACRSRPPPRAKTLSIPGQNLRSFSRSGAVRAR